MVLATVIHDPTNGQWKRRTRCPERATLATSAYQRTTADFAERRRRFLPSCRGPSLFRTRSKSLRATCHCRSAARLRASVRLVGTRTVSESISWICNQANTTWRAAIFSRTEEPTPNSSHSMASACRCIDSARTTLPLAISWIKRFLAAGYRSPMACGTCGCSSSSCRRARSAPGTLALPASARELISSVGIVGVCRRLHPP